MTTTVKVSAHCDPKKVQVSVGITSVGITSEGSGENHVLQDGEEREFFVYDDRKVVVQEVDKPDPA